MIMSWPQGKILRDDWSKIPFKNIKDFINSSSTFKIYISQQETIH